MAKLNVGERFNVYKVHCTAGRRSFLKVFEDEEEAVELAKDLARTDMMQQFEFIVCQEGKVQQTYRTWFTKERWK